MCADQRKTFERVVVGFPHRLDEIGGPASFQLRLEAALSRKGVDVVYGQDYEEILPDVILVVRGTRRIFWLIKMKIKGARIVHRLDGKNWHQSISKDGFFRAIKARLQDFLVYFIWRFLADQIVYQSRFVASIWIGRRELSSKETIIYNGVDLKEFAPKVYDQKNLCKCEVICVEGTISGMPAVKILRSVEGYNVSVYGRVSQEVMSEIERSPIPDVKFFGPIERNMVSSLYSYGSIFLNLETNPACPNSVIEALASGVPVVGFDSGSLRELVGDAGIVLPYGEGNPWRLDSPDCEQLGWAIRSIFLRYDEYSQKARSRAEKMYSMDSNAELYLDVLTAKPITGRDCD